MKLPKLEDNEKYVGLYVFDFGDHAGLGFTAREVAELLESEKYKNGKAYKIHKAYPAEADFKNLVNLAIRTAPPCRAKVHLTKYSDDKFVTAIIYPAEYDDEISSWLLEGEYETAGVAEGGIGAVQRYYDSGSEILHRHQLFDKPAFENRTGEELLAAVRLAVQR
ncbi:MAG: hypothetical protein ACYSW8_33260 [Planctomycetota bacterium]|jgi:hypothetical protein